MMMVILFVIAWALLIIRLAQLLSRNNSLPLISLSPSKKGRCGILEVITIPYPWADYPFIRHPELKKTIWKGGRL